MFKLSDKIIGTDIPNTGDISDEVFRVLDILSINMVLVAQRK